jgi:hypothetical protein
MQCFPTAVQQNIFCDSAKETWIKYINIFKYRKKFSKYPSICRENFCPVISSTEAIPMLYQMPFSFLACRSSPSQGMKNFLEFLHGKIKTEKLQFTIKISKYLTFVIPEYS